MTFPELVDAVADATKSSKRVSEAFLKELFALITETLRAGEAVKVPHLGTFKMTDVEARKSVDVNTGQEIEIAAHKKVTFVPDRALADAINAPFASFTPVEVDDEIAGNDLDMLSRDDESRGDEEPARQDTPVEADTGGIIVDTARYAQADAAPEAPVTEAPVTEAPVTEAPVTEAPAEEEQPAEPPSSRYVVPEEHEEEEYLSAGDGGKKDNRFVRGFIWGALTMFVVYLIAGVLVYAYGRYAARAENEQEIVDESGYEFDGTGGNDAVFDESQLETGEATPPQEQLQEPAKAEEAPVPVQNAVVLDTITRTKYLTRIANKHYGNAEFWVYIYEENKSKINNPNKIAAGTVVVIPPAEKYGIDKDDPASVAKAKAKAEAIQKRFK